MSLQRGANIRGWEGVTRNMAVNHEERAAWRFSMFSLILTIIVTGLAASILAQTDIPTIAKALLGILVLLFTLVLISGIYSTMVGRASGRTGADIEDETIHGDQDNDLFAEFPNVMTSRVAQRDWLFSSGATGAADAKMQRTAEPGPNAEEAARTAEQERQRATVAEADLVAEEAGARAAAAEAEAARAADAKIEEAHPEEERLRANVETARTQAAAEEAVEDAGPDHDGDRIAEGTDEGVRPQGLDAARNGRPDDLKLIKGIGPKLEELCNRLGFWHFDQIAAWSADEIAWVDSNLEGFNGRVTRDEWVSQAKTLAAGGETEFSKRQ